MRLLIVMLAILLIGCDAGTSGSASTAQCASGENLLANADFGSSDPASALRPWTGAQHAGEKSFQTRVDSGVLTIEKIGTQPWYRLAQTITAADLQGDSLVFRSEVKLSLDAANLAGGFTPGGGLQVLVWGDPDPVTEGDRIVFDSTLAHEPRLGTTDWMEVSIPFEVPFTATRIRIGYLLQANGSMQVRNPGLFRCGS